MTDGRGGRNGAPARCWVVRASGWSRQGVDPPSYTLDANFPDDTLPMLVTITVPGYCGGGTTTPYGLAGRVFTTTLGSRLSSSSTLAGDTTRVIGPDTLKWTWSLGPEA